MDVERLMPRFQNTASNTGTRTTETPVRKADFDGVVYFRPLVWSSLPMNRNIPTRHPERTAPAGQAWQLTIENCRQHDRRKTHAYGVEEKRRNVRERILDDNKIRAPDQGDQDQKNMRFEGAGHGYRVAKAELRDWGPGKIGETRTRAPAPHVFLEICSNCLASQAKQSQQNAFESEFASAAIKPFLQSMRAAAGAAAADGNRFKSERQRNVGIGGGTLNLGGVSSCASTARMTCRMWASGRSSPAGRLPIGTNSQLRPKGRRRAGTRASVACDSSSMA